MLRLSLYTTVKVFLRDGLTPIGLSEIIMNTFTLIAGNALSLILFFFFFVINIDVIYEILFIKG
jgi:hypothetical protein